MTHRIITGLAAVACASLVACSTVATLGTDSNTALKELTAVRQTRDQLSASKDLAGLSRYHASNLTAKLADGTRLDRAGYEALLQKEMESGVNTPSISSVTIDCFTWASFPKTGGDVQWESMAAGGGRAGKPETRLHPFGS